MASISSAWKSATLRGLSATRRSPPSLTRTARTLARKSNSSSNPTLNMSDQSQWQWISQIKLLPHYGSRLVAEFSTDSTYYAPGTLHPTVGTTLVSLFLPRELNTLGGEFSWELYSISPVVYSPEFIKPDDWPVGDVWPPATTLRTWLNGDCSIVIRTATTDVMPGTGKTLSNPLLNQAVGAVSVGPFVVGPNGRVP